VNPKPITLGGRILRPHKAAIEPLFSARSVLTNEPWTFVSLSLKREKRGDAGLYWEQSRTFFEASKGLPLESAPLLLYYSFMNAAKALLSAKDVEFSPFHGVKRWRSGMVGRDRLKTMGVEVLREGVLPALSGYFGEKERSRKHTMKELFFNMPFIHRAYCLTYKSQTEMFVPLKDCAFMWNSVSKEAFFSARLSKDYSSGHVLNRLPDSLMRDVAGGPSVRSRDSVSFARPGRPSLRDLERLSTLHRELRGDLYYINGVQTLWYAKAVTAGPARLARRTPTLVLAAMHCLSELCRYFPLDMTKLLSGDRNWIVSEFIAMASAQFIDEIASELTGHQFLIPSVRGST
jgi:hypothetical protein